MSSPDVSMAFTEDQLTVTVPEAQLTNGLDALSPPLASESCASSLPPTSTVASNWPASSLDVVCTTTSTSLTTNSTVVTTCNTTHSSTRFTVQPTRADQTVNYQQLDNRPSFDILRRSFQRI